MYPEVNSLKRLSGACNEGERPLLLRKECGNDEETRLLRKECTIDFRRKWLCGACNEGGASPSPSEGVKDRFSAKMALGEVS